jgi:ubiquinone/menaquinone biosynthesis C-methylase UbiE
MRWDPDQWAQVYESPRRSGLPFVFRRGAQIAREECLALATPGELWADVGCGTGHLAADLARAGLEVVGVDSDPEMVDFARRRFAHATGPRGPRFETAPAERLPFGDGTLDGLVATALAGVLDDLDGFLREARRTLRHGGIAAISFTNRSSALHAIRGATRRPGAEAQIDRAIRLYRAREAKRALEAAGMMVREIRFYNYFLSTARHMVPPRPLALTIERIAGDRVGARVARNFLAVASKPGD